MSTKFIDILTGQVEIANEYQNLTFTSEDYSASVKYPLFYITSTDVDQLYPYVIENASQFLDIVENLKEEIQAGYEALVTAWYSDPLNTDQTVADHELSEVDFLRIEADALSQEKADLFLTALNGSNLKGKFEVFQKLKAIQKFYVAKPFAICIHPLPLHTVIDSEDANDVELINRIYEEKNIKFIFNLSDSGAVSFTKCDAFVEGQNMLYLAVSRDFGDENLAKPENTNAFYAKDEVVQEFYDVTGPLTNFVPDFTLKHSCGIANTVFDPEAEDIFSTDELEMALKVYNLEKETEKIRVRLTVKEIALPVVADELYAKYNGYAANTVFDYVELPYAPTYYLKGVGNIKDDIADDYRCINMCSIISKDSYITHMVCLNEEDYYSKELNIKAGTEKAGEDLYAVLKSLGDQKKIKKSKLGEISFVVNNRMRKLVDSRTLDSFNIRKMAFEEVLDETTQETEEKLVVEAVIYFSIGFTKVQIFNKYIF